MKHFNKTIRPDIFVHCYQRTVDGSLLFYSVSDHLVFFTRYCITAKKYDIVTHALCQMPDHIHSGVSAQSREVLSRFWSELQTLCAKDNNSTCRRKGHLFERGFGSAVKYGEKNERTCLLYIGNNPVERHLVRYAEDYKWNYLAYADTDHPFSKKLVIRRASASLKKAIRTVKDQYSRSQILSYPLIQRLFKPLDDEEKLQLVDYIIVTYSVIDYSLTRKLFGSTANAIQAMHYSGGSEHDFNEKPSGKSDGCYAQLSKYLLENLSIKDIHEVLAFPDDQKAALYLELKDAFHTVPPGQIAKFLRIPQNKKPKTESSQVWLDKAVFSK